MPFTKLPEQPEKQTEGPERVAPMSVTATRVGRSDHCFSPRLVAAPLLLPSKPNLKQSRRRNLETIVFPGSTAKPAETETEISLGTLPFEREEEEGGGRKK